MIYALRELGNVRKGQTVLIHSAAGGCGTFALGICKQLGVKVVATVGSDSKVQNPRWLFLPFRVSCFTVFEHFGFIISFLRGMAGEASCRLLGR